MAKAPTKPKAPALEEAPVDPRARRVQVQASALLAAIKDVSSVVRGSDTAPILSNLHFEAGDGVIMLTGTDLDIWVETTIGADFSELGFATTIPAVALRDVVAEFDGEAMVEIILGDGAAGSLTNRITVSAGRASFKLNVLPATDFPLVPDFSIDSEFEMQPSVLGDALDAVDHAISTESTRYYLNGVFMHPEDMSLHFAATDGSRLARVVMEVPDGAASLEPVIIARSTVKLLGKLLAVAAKTEKPDKMPEPVFIEVGGANTKLRFTIGDTVITAKPIDGNFPDVSRVIPTQSDCISIVERAPLQQAVHRVMALADKSSRVVRAVFTAEKLELHVRSPDTGEGREELPCNTSGLAEGQTLEIGFNGKFWIDSLAAMASDNISIAMTDPQGPVRLQNADGDIERFVQVLMPVRI